MARSFRTVNASDPLWDQLQANIAQAITPAINCPLIDGVLIKDVDLTTSSRDISHGLGRPYQGWLVVDIDANQKVYSVSNNKKDRLLTLKASGATRVSIWVF